MFQGVSFGCETGEGPSAEVDRFARSVVSVPGAAITTFHDFAIIFDATQLESRPRSLTTLQDYRFLPFPYCPYPLQSPASRDITDQFSYVTSNFFSENRNNWFQRTDYKGRHTIEVGF